MQLVSDDDEKDMKPKVEPKSEVVSSASRRVGSSPAKSVKRRASSPIEVDLVKSDSEGSVKEVQVRESPKKKRKAGGGGGGPSLAPVSTSVLLRMIEFNYFVYSGEIH